MGQMVGLNLAACREENVRLRAAVGRLQGMLNAVGARDRAMEMEQRFIASYAPLFPPEHQSGAIRAGRDLARLYIEQLTAEEAEATEEKGASDVEGE
ncbi:MAG: hypothetical protein WC120_05330 [Parcubacteria group bacterium]|jgi:hypothetical protein